MNQYPIIMEDARVFSQYESNGSQERMMKSGLGIKDNESYRRYLVNNASNIITNNQVYGLRQNVPMNFRKRPQGTNTPHLFNSINDTKTPYAYEINTVKSKYLTQQQLDSNKKNGYKYVNI